MKKIGIIGASGYTGYELIKILIRHQKIELIMLNSHSNAGKKVSELYPEFNDSALKFTGYSLDDINSLNPDLLFLALPNGEAMKIVPQLKKRIKVVDLSADYRFKDKEDYEKIYKIAHSDKEKKSVYGLPELFSGKIKKAKLAANPGCYATASLLAALPIQKLAKYIVFDCKSGWSGAGKESAYAKNSSILKDNLISYNITKHRHKYEIQQLIKPRLSFTPHVINTFRGLMCTMHAMLKKPIDKVSITNIYKEFYSSQKFVKIFEDKIPDLHDVQNTNLCAIAGFEIDENNQLVVVSVIDNLLKGASGQAVQNMNLMFGYDEEEGLK